MGPKSWFAIGCCVSCSWALACGGRVEGSGQGGGNSNSGANSDVGVGGVTATSFSSSAVQAAQDQCAASVQPPPDRLAATIGEFRGQIVGAWWLCSTNLSYPPANAGPVVITDDGHWIGLVPDGNGGVVLGTAATGESTYTIETVFDGQTIADAAGQVLGTSTTVVVTSGDASETLSIEPRQSPGHQLWVNVADEPEGAARSWTYVQLAP
jgi:hypothetical protein